MRCERVIESVTYTFAKCRVPVRPRGRDRSRRSPVAGLEYLDIAFDISSFGRRTETVPYFAVSSLFTVFRSPMMWSFQCDVESVVYKFELSSVSGAWIR